MGLIVDKMRMPLSSLYTQHVAIRKLWPCRLIRFTHAALLALALVLAGQPAAAFATPYGGNAYGQCAYSADCPTSTDQSGGSNEQSGSSSGQSGGLDVIINVTDNQTFPDTGYEIIVKPAPDSTVPLQQAEVIIDGQSVGVRPVDSDGTVHIFVRPQQTDHGTIQLEVIVTGQDGTKVTKQYTVRLSPALITGQPPTPTHQATATLSFLKPVLSIIRPLPNVVKYALPYFLFLLLLLDMILLVFYTHREVDEQRKLRGLIERERQVVSLKQTFVALTSHYLRTPLAVLSGGADLLASLDKTQNAALATLRSALTDLHARIEGLIKYAAADHQAVTSQPAQTPALPPTSTRPMLLIPVLLAGAAAFAFDYLAQSAGNFSLSEINLIMQAVVFGSIAVVLYIVVRTYQLSHQKLKIARQVLADEQGLNEQRDSFIAEASAELNTTLTALDAALAAAGPTPASKFLDQGQKRLHSVADKLTVAARIKGSDAKLSPELTRLKDLAEAAQQTLRAKMDAKKVHLTVNNDQVLQLADPNLITYVLQTLVDNAVDYSPESGNITIASQAKADSLAITVTDEGAGIDPQKKFALFEAFSKLEGATTFNREGMGFSLYLDRLIMTYLHGSITLDNAAPHGAQATISLPVEPNS